MTTMNGSPANFAPEPELLAIHLLRELTTASRVSHRPTLDDLAVAVGARRSDVRQMLSALHREGLVDVLHMRPTLAGFALGRAASSEKLRPLRAQLERREVRAA